MTDAWKTNTTLDEIAADLRVAAEVVLLTHEKPDGDAVGATLALARTLARIGVPATPVYNGGWSARFDPIVSDTPVLRLGDNPDLTRLPESPARIVIVDTGAWSQLAKVRPWLEPRTDRSIVIDHHLMGDTSTAARRHIDTGVAAVCETIAQLCRRLLGVDRIVEFTPSIAEPLYLGLATDTGWFRHSNVSAHALRLAADLLDAGADHSRLYRLTEQSDNPCRLRLIGRALSSMRLVADDAGAIMTLSRQDLRDCHATGDDTGGLTDMLLSIASVRVAASLTEVGPTRTKISFRSKIGDNGDGAIDVNHIAHTLGGGGHAQAAGARLDLPMDEARQRVERALTDALT